MYFDDNDNNNNITITTIEIVLKKRLKLEDSILTITYYEELKSLVVKTKRFVIVTQTNANYRNKIYKIYSNNQILLKIIETIKSTINQIYL